MKKLIVCIAALAMSAGVYAQDFSWGVRAGLNISSLSINKGEDGFKSKVGFNVGLMGDYAFSESVSIESGLYFSQIGAKIKSDTDKATTNLGYLQLPILATYHLAISDNAKWSIQAGPYLAVGLGGKIKVKEEGVTVKVDSFGDGEDNGGFQRFDMGLTFGTGVTFGQIYVGVKYDLGLSNIMTKDIQDLADGYSIKNGNFSINVGYNF